MRLLPLLIGATLIACSPLPEQQSSGQNDSADSEDTSGERIANTILESFAEAWRGAEEFRLSRSITLGVWVDDQAFTIRLSDSGGTLVNGEPSQFDWGFETDLETLRRIDDGSLNALTAMGQARASDPIPLDIRVPDDFSGADEIRSFYIPLTFHFWNRDWPETIKFGDGFTREVHGANTIVLIYDEGLRTAWYQLKSGMHINAELEDQVNEFDTAIVVTEGQFSGRIGGEELLFEEGQTVIIPSGVTHEFFADGSQYGEFVILMWGDGA